MVVIFSTCILFINFIFQGNYVTMLEVTITYGHDRQPIYFMNLNKKHSYYGSHISLSCIHFINFIFQGKLLFTMLHVTTDIIS